jgi:hypothetical protein
MQSEMGRQIGSDLKYLQSTWNQEEVDDDFLRRDSVILRRLGVDGGGGILRTYRKELGHKGDIKVEAVDLKRQLEGLDRSLVEFASAGGASHHGAMVAGALKYRAVFTDEQIRARYQRGLQMRKMGLTRFLNGTCLVLNGRSVSRRNVIQYVANRVGGVHFDVTRDRLGPEVEAQFVAMDRAMETFNVADKRCVYFELLAIGQILVASPDVAELLEP